MWVMLSPHLQVYWLFQLPPHASRKERWQIFGCYTLGTEEDPWWVCLKPSLCMLARLPVLPELYLMPSAWEKKWSKSRSVVSYCLQSHGLYSPWNSPGQNTGVGSLSLLQGIFPTQGSNQGLLHCRQILYQLSHRESPRMMEWVTFPFSRGSSQPRNWTRVSCIAGRFFPNWATRETWESLTLNLISLIW